MAAWNLRTRASEESDDTGSLPTKAINVQQARGFGQEMARDLRDC